MPGEPQTLVEHPSQAQTHLHTLDALTLLWVLFPTASPAVAPRAAFPLWSQLQPSPDLFPAPSITEVQN